MAENIEVGVTPGTVPPAKTAADLRKLLRAKMAATLQAHQKLAAAQAALAQTTAYSKQCLAALNAVKLPGTKKEQEVRDFLEMVRKRHMEWRESVDAHTASSLAVNESSSEWHSVRLELSEAVVSASVPELESDETLGAAKYMSTQLAPPRAPAASPAAPKDVVPPPSPLSADELKLMADMWDATVKTGILASKCLHLAPALAALKKSLEANWRPSVLDPVRPTEEEVQRYLKQVEEACFERLKCHRDWLDLNAERETLADAMSASLRELQKFVGAASGLGLGRSDEFGATSHAAQVIVTSVSTARQALDQGHTSFPLDQERKPAAPSKREVGQIAELRKLMRNLAYAKAHRSEARAAQRVLPVKDEVFRLAGISASKTWAECLQWRAQADISSLEIERRNKARKEKAELLASLVAQYEQDVEDASKVLYRYVVTITPAPEKPPCDEMRCMLNAAALAYQRNSGGERKRCDFPIY